MPVVACNMHAVVYQYLVVYLVRKGREDLEKESTLLGSPKNCIEGYYAWMLVLYGVWSMKY